MAEEKKTPTLRAYLLLTFDLNTQQLIASEGAIGDPSKKFEPVNVDWLRLLTGVAKKKPVPHPPEPPWGRAIVDEDYEHRGTPLTRAAADDKSAESEETPPKV